MINKKNSKSRRSLSKSLTRKTIRLGTYAALFYVLSDKERSRKARENINQVQKALKPKVNKISTHLKSKISDSQNEKVDELKATVTEQTNKFKASINNAIAKLKVNLNKSKKSEAKVIEPDVIETVTKKEDKPKVNPTAETIKAEPVKKDTVHSGFTGGANSAAKKPNQTATKKPEQTGVKKHNFSAGKSSFNNN